MASERLSKFFEFSFYEKHRVNGFCKICRKNYKDASGIYSNFVKHLKRKHLDEYEEPAVDQSESSCETKDPSDDQVVAKLTGIRDKQNQYATSVTKNLIIRCNLPLNIVEQFGFRNFLKECNLKFEPISSKRIKRVILPSLKTDIVNKIHQSLSGVDALCLTIDAWSNKRCRSFLGITCHFINQHMKPEAVLLDFLRLKSPHTGDTIQQLTEEVLDQFDLKEKVFKITTDNASNMTKAFKFGLFSEQLLDASVDPMKSVPDVDPSIDDHDGERCLFLLKNVCTVFIPIVRSYFQKETDNSCSVINIDSSRLERPR